MDDSEPIGLAASRALAEIPQAELNAAADAVARPQPSRAEVERKLRQRINQERTQDYTRLHTVSGSALTSIEDRLLNGDAIVNAEGEVVGRRPVRLRDLTTLTGMVFDRKIAIEKRILGEDEGHRSPPLTPKTEQLLIRLELFSRERPLSGEVRGEFREPKVLDAEAND